MKSNNFDAYPQAGRKGLRNLTRIRTLLTPTRGPCPICGGASFSERDVLWKELIDTWQLANEEAAYVNRQQGAYCRTCGGNFRSLALAQAIANSYGYEKRRLPFVLAARPLLRVLEINQAGALTPILRYLPRHSLVTYPEVDMCELPFADRSFDLVVHSDTLEHVPDPVRGLRETFRVLRPGGITCFTVPIVVGRLTRPTTGRPASYHSPSDPQDYRVHTEYGADVWLQVLDAGFASCTIHGLQVPAALAVSARRPKAAGWLRQRRGL